MANHFIDWLTVVIHVDWTDSSFVAERHCDCGEQIMRVPTYVFSAAGISDTGNVFVCPRCDNELDGAI